MSASMHPSPEHSGGRIGVKLSAPAKINPYLEVVGRREDGFHGLDMYMATLDLVDELELCCRDIDPKVQAPSLSLTVEELEPGAARGCPQDGTNLAWRAARLAQERARMLGLVPRSIEMCLKKRIPSAAGLGGGSSDAAAALFGAAVVLGLDPDDAVLRRGLAQLGSDCAFFLEARQSGAARCTGRGDEVEGLMLPTQRPWVILVTPEVRAATPQVYASLAAGESWTPTSLPILADLFSLEAAPFCRLEAAALDLASELQAWRLLFDQVVQASGGELGQSIRSQFTLSGSGSTFFALAPDHRSAQVLLNTTLERAKTQGLNYRYAGLHNFRGQGFELDSD